MSPHLQDPVKLNAGCRLIIACILLQLDHCGVTVINSCSYLEAIFKQKQHSTETALVTKHTKRAQF
jgi:hypothetical protein